jgi:hypothetical protein
MLEIELPGKRASAPSPGSSTPSGLPASESTEIVRKSNGNEREQREVGDHRGEVRAAVLVELASGWGSDGVSPGMVC